MAAQSKEPPAEPMPQFEPLNRWAVIGLGAVIGFGFGSFMWVVTGLKGDWHVWLYLAMTTAMLGVGVAAVFGASMVKRQGKRVTPKMRRRR